MSVDIAQLGFRVESLEADLAARRLRDLGRAANDAETASMRLARQAQKTGKQMQMMGRNMSLYLTAPLLALGAASVKSFASFDDAMVASMAIMGDLTDAIVDEMTVAAREMGKTTIFSAKQAADSYFFLASAGLSAEASIAALSKVAAFAQAGTFDMARATDILTDAQSALGLIMVDPIENMQEMVKLSDILVKANTIANASVQQFGESLTNKAGAAMKSLNIDVEEGVAVLAAYADQGIKSMEAGEKFNIVTRDLQTAIRKNADEFDRFGIKVFNAQGALNNLGEIIADLERVLGPMSVQQQGATLALLGFQDRSVIAIRQLIGMSDNIKKYEKALRSAGGITDEVANKQLKSFSKQMGLMASEINDVAIQLGGTLAPAVIEIMGEVRGMAQAFGDLSPATQKLIVKSALLVAALGPLVMILGSAVRLLAFLIPWLIKFSIVILTRVIPATWAWIASLGGTFGVVALITILTTGVGFLVSAVGGAYVRALEKAIIHTDKFIAALNGLEVTGLEANLKSVAGEVERLTDLQIAQTAALVELQENSRDSSYQTAQIEAQAAALEETNAILASRIRLRDSYTERLREAILATQELTTVTEDLNTVEAVTAPLSLTDDEVEALQDLQDELDPTAKALRELKAAYALLEKALKTGDLNPKQFDEFTKALHRSDLAMDAFADQIGTFRDMDIQIQANLQNSFAFIEGLELMEQQVQALEDSLDPTEAALRGMAEAQELLNEALAEGVIDETAFNALSEAVADATTSIELMDDAFQRGVQEWLTPLQEMQGLFHEDSAEAELLRTAMLALNIVMGINAVIKQLAGGDVYSAIPRAVAVAAMVASMGVQTGAAGRGASSRSLQETQGTGTVLGDAEAKSESLLNASEITAKATSELVGINRGMLHALQNLQTGLGGAATQLARGSGDADFGALPTGLDIKKLLGGGLLDKLGFGFLGDFLNKIFGGKSKILDEGIRIVGGYLSELSDEVLVQAFQLFKSKKHLLASYKEGINLVGLGDEVSIQFALVFASLADTVMEGALALGVPLSVIEERLATFQIATQDISFSGLTGEEIEEELLAVFGSIFDDLALHVVPFIGEFQKVGEGLGETLIRVATSVQVVEEALNILGFAADAVDPLAFAHIAVGLVELAGGVEEFISQFTLFFDRFASEEAKLEFATDQLTRAFDQAGMSLPLTRDGFFELMQTLDATTESGREQIATLLRLAPIADAYYSLLEDAEESRLKQAQIFKDFVGTGAYGPLENLTNNFLAAMNAADSLGASTKEYAMIARAFNAQLKRMAAELTISVLSLTQQLFGNTGANDPNPIDEGLENTRQVANSVFTEWQRALEDIFDYTQNLLLDDELTTLTPAEQFAEAQNQFNELVAKAQAGDVDAAAKLPDAAQALLEEARFMFASGQEYSDIFNATLAALEDIAMPGDIPEFVNEVNVSGIPGFEDMTPMDQLISTLERYLLAYDLAGALNNLAQVLGVSVVTLAQDLGVPLRELATILGVELDNLTTGTAAALAEVALVLGADVFELMDALGIPLRELAIITGVHLDTMSQELATELGTFAAILGVNVFDLAAKLDISITELATAFGIGIGEFNAAQFGALLAFSEALGVGIGEVATALDINLGEIADATSILSQAFDTEIEKLPPETASELQPYLDAIRDATNEADANIAIGALGEFILGLPPAIAAPLLPFLELMGFDKITKELKAILDIEQNTRNTISAVDDVEKAVRGVITAINNLDLTDAADKASKNTGGNSYEGVDDQYDPSDPFVDPIQYNPPGYALGGSVDRTGLYQLHAGEFVVTKSANNLAVTTTGGNESSDELKEISLTLRDIRDQNKRYQDEHLATSRDMESSMKDQAENTRRFANG